MSGLSIFEKLSGPISVGTLLRAYRLAHSLSAAALEKKIKMSKSSISSIESGKKTLTLQETVLLAQKIGEPVDYYIEIWLAQEARAQGVDRLTFLSSLSPEEQRVIRMKRGIELAY